MGGLNTFSSKAQMVPIHCTFEVEREGKVKKDQTEKTYKGLENLRGRWDDQMGLGWV